ncbi:Atp-binding protein, partial [Globisporangium splendens]
MRASLLLLLLVVLEVAADKSADPTTSAPASTAWTVVSPTPTPSASTTSAPAATTEESPEDTTTETPPGATTAALTPSPVETTPPPPASTTAVPLATTTTPPATETLAPAATTEAPTSPPVSTTEPPARTMAAPAPTTAAPVSTTVAPAPTTAAPTVTPSPPPPATTVVPSPSPAVTQAAASIVPASSSLAPSSTKKKKYTTKEASNTTTIAVSALAVTTNVTCDPDYEVKNATTGACDCKPGFSGWGCRMCASSGACKAIRDDYTCSDGLKYDNYTEIKTYTCRLDPDLQSLFEDGAMDVVCNRTSQNCSAAVYKAKNTVNSEHVLDCQLTGCVFKDGSANGACKAIKCKCGPQCSPMAKAIIEGTLNGKPATIRATNATSLAIDIEGSPLPLSAQCKASQCEFDGTSGGSGSGSGGGGDDPALPSTLIIAVVTCASVAGAILICVFACSCFVTTRIQRGNHGDMETELAALASQSGKVFEFKSINCYASRSNADKSMKSSSSSESEDTKRILHKISGRVERGSVLGLLGPSGSGKTSLLNALAAVENGHSTYSGEILVDGKKISKDYRKIAAYVQQDDSLYSTLTVRECIAYSAQLRLPCHVSDTVKDAMVERVISELNLGHVVHSRIGSQGQNRGISGGERRRVSIGMELVTSPQILFLDEPTSGLDSSSANSVVQLVKELASHGRIVIMSIHQPSAKSFLQLDQVMLLAKGKMLYHGPPGDSKTYFQDLGFICPENENIADFILDIASDAKNIPNIRAHMKSSGTPPRAATARPAFTPKFTIGSPHSESSPFMTEDTSLDTPRIQSFVGSPTNDRDNIALTSLPTPPASRKSPRSPPELQSNRSARDASSSSLKGAPSRSLLIEIRVLFRRTAQNIFRHRSLLLLHVLLSLVLALFGGLIFNHVTNDLAGFQNRSGAFYFILTFFGFSSMSSMDLFIAERSIFLRETGALYYGAFSYFLAKATLDTLLLRVFPATLFASIFYWIMGLQASLEHFFLFLVTLVLFNVAAGAISILVGVLSRNVGTANLSATVVFLIMLLFGGFLLNSQTMPAYVGWIKHFSIFSYAFEILMTNELKGLLLKFDAPGYPSVPVYGDVFLKTLGMDYANRYYDLVSLAVIAIGLQILSYLFLSLQVPQRQELVVADEDARPAPLPSARNNSKKKKESKASSLSSSPSSSKSSHHESPDVVV